MATVVNPIAEPLLSSSYNEDLKESSPSSDNLSWWMKIFVGGTQFDAFMMEASQQVGQSLLSLPWAFSLMGLPLAIISLLGLSLVSMWTQTLLIGLLTEFRHNVACDMNHSRHGDKNYITSYHEVIGALKGKAWGTFSLVIVFLALLGLSVAQITATASNLYLLNAGLEKRTYALIAGGVFSTLCFVPNFRDYRFLSFLGIASTFYSACHLTITAVSQGPSGSVDYGGPQNFFGFFTGFCDLLFMFGGHTAAIEKAVKMDRPDLYDRAYGEYICNQCDYVAYYVITSLSLTSLFFFFFFLAYATLYVYAITLPTGISGYHTFGLEASKHSNAFYLFDSSIEQRIGVALMW